MHPGCIVTYRGAPGSNRRANLDTVLAWLARSPDLETIVVEQGDRPRLVASTAHPDARVVFAFRDGPLRKGWGRNVGARHASGDVPHIVQISGDSYRLKDKRKAGQAPRRTRSVG